jgi:SAM-dependent methyltransferase
MGTPTPADWGAIGLRLNSHPADSLWRAYCDRLNRQWLTRHLGGQRFQAALKTDAFDEAVGEGACPLLGEVAERVFAMDISASTCRLATERRPMFAVACDVRKLPFAGDSFDLVISLSTLDHFASVVEMEEALRCVHRVLRPEGRLLLTLDNLSNPLVRLRNAVYPRIFKGSRLVPFPVGVTVSPEQLRLMLERAGFQVRNLTTLMHILRVPAVALAALLDRVGGPSVKRLSSGALLAFEFLSQLPTARWTGNYIAVACSKGSRTLPSK